MTKKRTPEDPEDRPQKPSPKAKPAPKRVTAASKTRAPRRGDAPGRPRIHASHAPAPGGPHAADAKPRKRPAPRAAAPAAARKTPLAAPKRPAGGRKSGPPSGRIVGYEPSAASRELAIALAAAGIDKKAVGIEILDVSGRVDYADFLVIMTGRSDRHVHAIATGIEDAMRQKRMGPTSIEGLGAATWVLMDFGDVVVHVFQEEARLLYDIEGLWIDASRVPVPADGSPGGPTPGNDGDGARVHHPDRP